MTPSNPQFLPVAEPDLGPLEEQFLLEAVRSGWISSIGEFINRLEREFAAFCGVDHCVALANGTVALHVALLGKGIGPGDEVIVPDLTFVATAAAVCHAGATPVLVDVDPVSMCMDANLVAEAISPRTKAIIPVHLFGHPADMTALGDIAKPRGIFLLEDAAEAHGARIDNRRVGSLGDAGTFSFYGNKLLTTGEGGCITTNDAAFAKRVRFLKDHAMSPESRYFHSEVGFNYRMTNLQAAIGCAQLSRFEEMLACKAAVLQHYRNELQGTEIELNPHLSSVESVCWLVTALLPGSWNRARLDRVAKLLREEHSIDSRPFFVPLHDLPPYRSARFTSRGEAVSTALANRGICLPSSNHLSQADVARVCRALKAVLKQVG